MILNELSAWQFEGSFEEFYKIALQKNDIFKQTHKQPKQSFIIKDGFRILSDTITHTVVGHALTPEQWEIVIKLLNDKNIIRQDESLSPRFNGNPIIYSLTDGTNLYGICVEYFKNKLPYITTAFIGTEKEIEQWFKRNEEHTLKIKKGNRQGEAKTSVTTEGLLLGRVSINSITPLDENVKTLNNFYKWFGNSKVVDNQGNPLVVYHGSPEKFEIFEPERMNYGSISRGFCFFTNKKSAYPNCAKDYAGKDGYIYECYLKIEKPLHIKYGNTPDEYYHTPVHYWDTCQSDIRRDFRKGDYDGIIIENLDKSQDDSVIYLVPNANQIKSIDAVSFSDSDNIYEEYKKTNGTLEDYKNLGKIKIELPEYTVNKTEGMFGLATEKGIIEIGKNAEKIDFDHEIAHQLSNGNAKLAIAIMSNYGDAFGRFNIDTMKFEGIGNSPEESFAHAYSLYINYPEKLKERYPNAFKAIEYILSNITNLKEVQDNFYNAYKINEQLAYHGTRAKFDKFDLDKIKDWRYGYGIYFTRSKGYAANYGDVKEYELPENEYLLDWEDSLDYQSEYIQEILYKIWQDTKEHDKDRLIEKAIFGDFANDGEAIYYAVSEALKLSGKATSEFLYKYGIKGIDSFKGDCIVIFHPDDIKKSIDENTATLEKETLPELNNNFWHWFGDSVVKDDDGNPLICFHGSTLDIDEFDTEYSGKNTGNNEEKVFYFTTDREMAVSYSTEAVIRQKEIPYYDKEEGTEYETWEEFEDYLRTEVCKTPHINPCFICMEKPYIYDAGFRDFDPKLNYTLMSMIKGEIDKSHWLFDEELYYEIAEEHEQYDEETDEYIQIKDFDYDGIIIRNVRDSISPLVDKYVDEYIVWHPNQIKSIYNKGNWSWNSRNVFEGLNKQLESLLEYVTPIYQDCLNQKELINEICKKKYEYRIIYDSNKDWYIIGTAYDKCHEQLLYNAASYYGFTFDEMTEYYNEHYMNLHDLLYTPKEIGLQLGFDHNDKVYTFKGFGSIYTKGEDLPKVLLDDLTSRFGKPIFKEKIKENLTKLEFKKDIIVADNLESLEYFLKTTKKDCRIVIDKFAGLSIISDVTEVHYNAFLYAVNEGWYGEHIEDNDEEYWEYHLESEDLTLLIFSKDSSEEYLGQDGFKYVFEYPFGYIYARIQSLPDELLNVIGQPVSTTESEDLDTGYTWEDWSIENVLKKIPKRETELRDKISKMDIEDLKPYFRQVFHLYYMPDIENLKIKLGMNIYESLSRIIERYL